MKTNHLAQYFNAIPGATESQVIEKKLVVPLPRTAKKKMLNIAVDPDKLLSPNGNFEVGRDDPDNAWKRNELPDVFGIFG